MSDYTPTEKDVRLTFAYIQGGLDHDDGYEPFYQVHEEEFDRFLAKAKADTLRRAAGQFVGSGEVRDELESYLYRIAALIEDGNYE